VLALLLRQPNEVVTRQELLDSVWEGRPTVDNVLANAVTKLRKALGPQGGARIVNVPRIGYRLVGEVQRVPAEGAGARGAEDAVQAIAGTDPGAFQAGMPVPGRPGFELLRPLGMSERRHVWLARQRETGRERVFKFATDAEEFLSLKREVALLRALHGELGDRPDIVRVVGVGFSEPPYHMECEYGGLDLLAWAAGPDAPLRGMARSDRLALFAGIADAVAAAHGVGVLHKDLKPANVLVRPGLADVADGGGPADAAAPRWQPCLTDFGSAHALDDARLKASGVTLMGLTVAADREGGPSPWSGTPLYWAPELLAGQGATTRSDVYALGLMLFQLVVGDLKRPLSTGWQREVDDELLWEDIAAATEGDPQRRLASAGELAERLRRLPQRREERAAQLAAQQALEQAQRERERRRVRRPWLAAAAVLLLLALGAGGWMFEQNRLALAEARVQAQRSAAMLDFVSRDVLDSADVTRVGGTRLLTMTEVVERAAQKLEGRFAGQPDIEAALHRRLGDILVRSQALTAAMKQYERAVALLEPPGATADSRESPLALIGWAQAQVAFYRPDEGEQLLQRARAALPAGELESVNETALRFLAVQVDVLAARQRGAEAIPVARDLLRRVDAWPQAALADRLEARQRLAELLLGAGAEQRPEGERLLKEITSAPYSAQSVGAVTFARAEMALASSLAGQNRSEEARRILLRVREVLTQLLGDRALHVGLVNFELANLVSNDPTGRPQQSLDYLGAAETAFAATLGPSHGYTISVRNNKAIPLLQLGQATEALVILDEVLPWYEKRKLGDAIQYYRAWALNDLGRCKEALEALDGIDVKSAAWLHVASDPHMGWKVKFERGRALAGTGQRDQGRQLLRQADAEAQASGGGPQWGERIRRALVRA
jgi:non-specific serine/threonine protein kinase